MSLAAYASEAAVSAACNGMVVVLRQLIEEEGISPNAETNNHGRKLLHEVCFHTRPLTHYLLIVRGGSM